MSYSLRFLSEARADISDAYVWYEKKRDGLGDEFSDTLELIFERIKKHPTQFVSAGRNVRKATLQRFPYSIFFRIDGEDWVTIGAVYHSSRKPGKWEERFEE